MTINQRTLSLFLAAILLVTVSPGVWGRGFEQDEQDDSAAVITAPKPAGGAGVIPPSVDMKKGPGPVNRVLLWTGKPGSPLDKALSEFIVKQAFEDDGTFYRVASSATDFAGQASSGLFNILVLFEADERLENLDALRDRVSRGKGLVIIGTEDQSRQAAESFGFRIQESAPRDGGTALIFTGEPGIGLGGTVAVSGPLLVPQKPGAAAAALYGDSRKPAVLVDDLGSGRVIVMPFSLIRSARESGTTPVYSLLLRAAARSAAPAETGQGRVLSEELTVTASVDHLRTRIQVTLPQGAKLIWATPDGAFRNNTVVFELSAEQYPQMLQYFYELPGGGNSRSVAEFFYEADGKMVSGGKIE